MSTRSRTARAGVTGAARATVWCAAVVAALVFGAPFVFAVLGIGLDEAAMPPQGRTVSIGDGRSLHYVEQGSEHAGTPVVLVHGLPSNHADWAELPSALAERMRRRVIAYDRMGYGYSSRGDLDEAEEYTFESSSRDLLALLDALDIRQASLVGWSFGGGVVQTFAVAHPDRVVRVVFLASTGPPGTTSSQPGVLRTVMAGSPGQALVRWMARIPPLARAAARPELALAFSGEDAIPNGWIDTTIVMTTLPGTLEAIAAEHSRRDPAALVPESIRAPALVIHGTDDRLIDYAVAEDLDRRLPNSKLVPIFEGSHMLPVKRSTRVAEEIARFLGP